MSEPDAGAPEPRNLHEAADALIAKARKLYACLALKGPWIVAPHDREEILVEINTEDNKHSVAESLYPEDAVFIVAAERMIPVFVDLLETARVRIAALEERDDRALARVAELEAERDETRNRLAGSLESLRKQLINVEVKAKSDLIKLATTECPDLRQLAAEAREAARWQPIGIRAGLPHHDRAGNLVSDEEEFDCSLLLLRLAERLEACGVRMEELEAERDSAASAPPEGGTDAL